MFSKMFLEHAPRKKLHVRGLGHLRRKTRAMPMAPWAMYTRQGFTARQARWLRAAARPAPTLPPRGTQTCRHASRASRASCAPMQPRRIRQSLAQRGSSAPQVILLFVLPEQLISATRRRVDCYRIPRSVDCYRIYAGVAALSESLRLIAAEMPH